MKGLILAAGKGTTTVSDDPYDLQAAAAGI